MEQKHDICRHCGGSIYYNLLDARWYHGKNSCSECAPGSKGTTKAWPVTKDIQPLQLKPDQSLSWHQPQINSAYGSLLKILDEAFQQASTGKGKERHASDDNFECQPICQISRNVGIGFALGQAIKKVIESQRLDTEKGVAELLGAINYLAAAIIIRREQK